MAKVWAFEEKKGLRQERVHINCPLPHNYTNPVVFLAQSIKD